MDHSWRQQYQMEDEEEALARALELSRLDHGQQTNQAASAIPHDNKDQSFLPGQLARSDMKVQTYQGNEASSKPTSEPQRARVGAKGQAPSTHSAFRGSMASQTREKMATPLCLPNNCKWDSRSGQYVKTGEKRCSLYVVEEALEKLRKIKGPVCVVSIAGPYRKGKSYVLSEAFHQPQVFPLGHHMDPETMGIWLWIVPEKFKDSRGQEFTVVLLDSEGIDAATGEGLDDNQIFTLTVLLASVLIYNSQGVATRRDLEGLDFIVKLSHRIEMRSTTTDVTRKGYRESEYFHKTFPYFIWLLRDVTQAIPQDCSNIKEYFLKKVFKVHDPSAMAQEGQKVAESILSFFPGFEAFTLPSPTVDPEKLKSINDNKRDINPLFFRGLEKFKLVLRNILVPKNSFNDGELVTGEGLATLVQLYVQAINTPGIIPNVQNAWDTFVETKCSAAITDALDAYDVTMASQLKSKLPCENDQLRISHGMALESSEGHFMAETAGISTKTTEKYLKKLKESLGEKFNMWQIKNAKLTREFCNDLLIQLKQTHLDPVLQQLQRKEGAKLSFEDIIGRYNQIKDDYHKSAIGAKDVIAAVFFEFHPTLMKEQEQHLGLLRQLKDYDEMLTQELAAKAYQEQERQKLEAQQEQLRQENLAVKREMEMLSEKQNEEREKFREQMDSELQAQKEQMNNMLQANMEQAQQERKEFMRENKELKDQFLTMQKANEDNIKMIEKLSDLVAKQEEEKRRLNEQMEKAQAERERQEVLDRMEASKRNKQEEEKRRLNEQMEKAQAERERQELLDRMEARHREEKEKLRREMETKMEAQQKALTEEYRKAAQSRMGVMQDMQQKLHDVEKQLEEVKKPGFIKRAFIKVKEFGSAVLDKVFNFKENCVVM
ncbi:guanylate-binding protein 6-like isoform X2 [Oculina patagonica]